MTSKAIAVLVLILGVARVAYGIAIIQQNMTFKSCGSPGDIFTVLAIDVTPYPLESGQQATIELNFDSSESVTGGQVSGTISGMSLPEYDLCSNLPSSCPLEKGSHKFKIQQEVPGFVPPGDYTVTLEGKSNEGKPLFCTSLTVEVK